ncbi:uncharacterized protein LOC134694579 [Mytilus trossulus]|uniref:uncharacterized protein LOC134694579 n=1 Tax=Mytilus trossulus TaxID=6551 RepID=UPI00300765F1
MGLLHVAVVAILLQSAVQAQDRYCSNSQSYKALLSAIENNPCLPDSQVWHLLNGIGYTSCKHLAAQIMYDKFRQYDVSQCGCTGQYSSWQFSYSLNDHCESHFKRLLDHYGNTNHHNCNSHLFLWKDLQQIPTDRHGQYDRTCISDLTKILDTTMRSSPNNCHCVETGHNGQSGQQTNPPTTGSPVSTMFIPKSVYAGCNDHTANGKITELLNGLNRSPCMADTQVWDLIYNIRKPECRHAAAEIVHDKLRNFNRDQCECSGSYTHWPLRSYNYESDHCDRHFASLLAHYKNFHLHCHTHLFIWNNLRQIPVDGNGQYNYKCIYHLALEIKNAMHASTNTCQCKKKTIVTTDATVATTQPTPVPTVAQTTAATCDPVKTLAGVAHNTVVGQTSKCIDGIHSPAIYFVQSACSLNYRLSDLSPGQKMKDVCQTLPHYTAVAHFVGNVLDTSATNRDAGIFIGCGTDHFRVVTENCTTKLHVEHILFTDPKADSYYVINHP